VSETNKPKPVPAIDLYNLFFCPRCGTDLRFSQCACDFNPQDYLSTSEGQEETERYGSFNPFYGNAQEQLRLLEEWKFYHAAAAQAKAKQEEEDRIQERRDTIAELQFIQDAERPLTPAEAALLTQLIEQEIEEAQAKITPTEGEAVPDPDEDPDLFKYHL
jgi:hypothetical protein